MGSCQKKGGLNIVPPYSEKKIQVYSGRVEALANVLDFLKWQKEKYVVMADTNIACNFDFKEMLNQHIESGADVTVAIPNSRFRKASEALTRKPIICTTLSPWQDRRSARSL